MSSRPLCGFLCAEVLRDNRNTFLGFQHAFINLENNDHDFCLFVSFINILKYQVFSHWAMLEPRLRNPLIHETYTFNYIIINTFFPRDSSLLKA